jgi:hypothetical protein
VCIYKKICDSEFVIYFQNSGPLSPNAGPTRVLFSSFPDCENKREECNLTERYNKNITVLSL